MLKLIWFGIDLDEYVEKIRSKRKNETWREFFSLGRRKSKTSKQIQNTNEYLLFFIRVTVIRIS